jgi:hypothetical protein
MEAEESPKASVHYATHNYTTPHYTTPHYTTLHHTTPHHTTPHHTTPHFTTLHHTTPHYTTQHHTTLHHTTLLYTTLHHTTLHHTTQRRVPEDINFQFYFRHIYKPSCAVLPRGHLNAYTNTRCASLLHISPHETFQKHAQDALHLCAPIRQTRLSAVALSRAC